MTEQELAEILRRHELWLTEQPAGERAIMFSADLTGADLRRTDLSGAILDGFDLDEIKLRGAILEDTPET
jgi:hypothetical protein